MRRVSLQGSLFTDQLSTFILTWKGKERGERRQPLEFISSQKISVAVFREYARLTKNLPISKNHSPLSREQSSATVLYLQPSRATSSVKLWLSYQKVQSKNERAIVLIIFPQQERYRHKETHQESLYPPWLPRHLTRKLSKTSLHCKLFCPALAPWTAKLSAETRSLIKSRP